MTMLLLLLVRNFKLNSASSVIIIMQFINDRLCRWIILFFFFHLKKFIFHWRIIALQNFAVFCQIPTWISHRYTYIPSLLNLPLISPPSHPSKLIQSPFLSFRRHIEIPIGYLFYIWSWRFLCYSFHTSHPLLPSPHVHKFILYVFLYCCPVNKFFSMIFLDSVYMH